jgi:hypothetical protein
VRPQQPQQHRRTREKLQLRVPQIT